MGNRLFLTILLIGLIAVGGTWGFVTKIADRMLEEQANSESLGWAQFVKRDLPNLERLLSGAPPTIQDIQTLSTAKNVGNVVEFKIYDHDRTVVWAADFDEIGDENNEYYFTDLVMAGKNHVFLKKQEDPALVIAHAFMPLIDHGEFTGAIEVSLDLSHAAQNSHDMAFTITFAIGSLFVVLLIIAGLSARIAIQHERSLKEKAQQAAKARNDFVAMVSHELRTPLNGILGALELLKESESQKEKEDLTLTAIHSTEHLLQLINEIIDFTQVSGQRASLAPSRVDLNEMANEVGFIFKVDAQSKHINFEVKTDLPEQAFGRADHKRLRQIIFNLTTNALKFTQRGEVVVHFILNTKKKDRQLICHVSDTGIGMTPDEQENAFKRFHQIRNTLAREHGGIGLGLSLCKELAILMGGNLTVTSQPEKGSTFTLTLPFPEDDTIAAVPVENAINTPFCALKILLAEDNTVNQKILKAILEKTGHNVHLVENGLEALNICKDTLFDMILMDIQMPKMDGIEACKAIRTHEGPNQNTPIIALSANIFEKQQKEYMDAGMQACIAKPIKPQDLRREVMALHQKFSNNI
jgi:signal transduction histidine kinase/ActR/RegA family two-component response regulator